jgi:zinc/manganese transport system substrate-binding protein
LPGVAQAQEKLSTIASFSILADMVENVGGNRVEVRTLVGPGGDAHVYTPTPADAKAVAGAKLLFVNGLGFEGWMERLVGASGSKAQIVTASEGVTPRSMEEEEGHAHEGEKGHDHAAAGKGHDHEAGHGDKGHDHVHEADEEQAHGHGDAHDHGENDPHAFQSIANSKIYVGNIRDALIAADPAGKAEYEANATAYLAKLDEVDAQIRAAAEKIPAADRKIITSHDAFGYFGEAYGFTFLAPQGVSTDAEASAKDVATLVKQIRKEKVKAVFVENVTDKRLIQQISRESGAEMGGELYSDALSAKDGPAGTYIDLFRHNIKTLSAALTR